MILIKEMKWVKILDNENLILTKFGIDVESCSCFCVSSLCDSSFWVLLDLDTSSLVGFVAETSKVDRREFGFT